MSVNVKTIAARIPAEFRRKILLEWIPAAKANMANQEYKMLYEAYFLYVDPNGIRKDDCPICLNNILKTWKDMQQALVEEQQNYNALENL